MSEQPPGSRRGAVAGYTVPKRTRFPGVCVKCGRPDGLTARRRTFSYVSPTIYIAFTFGCVGMVLGGFFYLVTRRTMEVTVPTCSTCEAAWDRASRRTIMFFAGSLVATLFGSVLVWKVDADLVWLPIFGLAANIVGSMALHTSGRKKKLWAKNIDETTATLVGIHPAVVALLAAGADSSIGEASTSGE